MEISGLNHSQVPSIADVKKEAKQGLTDELLGKIDVNKVNAMFQQSLDAFEGDGQARHGGKTQNADTCRWDQFARAP